MKKLFLFTSLLYFVFFANAQNYTFSGTMSREVLENYLDRAITMQTLSDTEFYEPTETERQQDIAMIDDIGAKFVGRLGYWWQNAGSMDSLNALFDRLEENICEIKANDPEVICQGAIFEFVSTVMNEISIPTWVFQAFNQTPVTRNFRLQDMLYSTPLPEGINSDNAANTPDITKLETRMWFYYLAVRYINAGCEALHFGHIELMAKRDNGNALLWDLLQKVRNYAVSRNGTQLTCTNTTVTYRGVVICDAHVGEGGLYFDPNPANPLPTHQRQLLFDFHSLGTYYTEAGNCSSTQMEVKLEKLSNDGIIGRSKGGLHPLGWICVNNPYLLEFDHGGIATNAGCSYPNISEISNFYGFDNISWFARQNFNYRNTIYRYTYYKLKCLDKNGHFQFTGRRMYSLNGGNDAIYRAHSSSFNQQSTIRDIWNGVYMSPTNWVRHNFTDEEVINPPNPAHVKGNLIFVGDNRIYYVASDNRVHGYIKYNGAWLTVSPSYSSGNVSGQEPVAGGLVAKPDGTALFYRGVNGRIYRYDIINDWAYTYNAMPVDPGVIAIGDIICPTNSLIYYVGREPSNSNAQRVHGYKWNSSTNQWVLISPSHGSTNVNANSQKQANANLSLATNPSVTNLYYISTDGYVCRFQINSNGSYTYYVMPKDPGVTAFNSIIAPTDTRIYYIGKEPSNSNAQRVHGFRFYNNNWTLISPSYAAHAAGVNINSQVQASQWLAYNPNNNMLLYIGIDKKLYGFNIINDINYTYFNFANSIPPTQSPSNSLKFTSVNTLFYVSDLLGNQKIHLYRLEENFCANSVVQSIDPGCCSLAEEEAFLNERNNSKDFNFRSKEEHPRDLSIFPNPGDSEISVNLNVVTNEPQIARIYSFDGRVVSEFKINTNEIIKINTANFVNGSYYIVIPSRNKAVVEKFVIQH
ncbi:MAG: T9SS type A sorting domain-containing protein [Saprospiraceae bacterium]